MREIKFRAWHTKWGMMLDVLSIDFAGGLVYVQPLNDNSGVEEIDLNDVKLLQYTGMNDCNDKEIYEDYIVKMHYFFENRDSKSLGRFEDESEVVGVIKYCESAIAVVDGDNTYFIHDYVQEVEEEIEVIGNIYENPELVEEKQCEK